MTINKHVRIATTVIPWAGRAVQFGVFAHVQWDGRRLSISGVEGPLKNGDAAGGCGQIVMSMRERPEAYTPAEGIDLPRFLEIWDRWHLNDMRAGCEHQRAEGWAERPIDPSKPANAYGLHFEGQTHPSWNRLAWVRPEEHPDGLLTKPCPTCGYRYGSAWLHEDVPEDVIAYLESLPMHPVPPAWR